jgi:hypothetical protein
MFTHNLAIYKEIRLLPIFTQVSLNNHLTIVAAILTRASAEPFPGRLGGNGARW